MATYNPNDDHHAEDEETEQNAMCQALTIGSNAWGQQLNGTTDDVKQLQCIKHLKNKAIDIIQTMRCGATVFRYEDGEIAVGGYNGKGQLGVGSNENITRVKHLEVKAKIISQGISAEHVFIVAQDDDTLRCAGSNDYKQCGVDKDRINVWMAGPQIPIEIKQVATSLCFTVFLARHGIMFGCGKSNEGGLGMGQDTTKVSTPTMIPTQTKMECVVAGTGYCVALSQAGHAFGWGSNEGGCCGHGDVDNVYSPTQIKATKGEEMVSVSCGAYHTMFVSSTGRVFSTGYNLSGECGDGTTTHIFEPKPIIVGDADNIQKVACGASHTVVTTTTDEVFLFGNNTNHICLVFDDAVRKVLTPTQYLIPKKWSGKHKKVQVIPGYCETRIVISPVAKYIHLLVCGVAQQWCGSISVPRDIIMAIQRFFV